MYSKRPVINDCEKCGGEGWLWGRELDDPSEDTRADSMTRYTCDACHARQRCGHCGAFHDPLQTLEQECIDAIRDAQPATAGVDRHVYCPVARDRCTWKDKLGDRCRLEHGHAAAHEIDVTEPRDHSSDHEMEK